MHNHIINRIPATQTIFDSKYLLNCDSTNSWQSVSYCTFIKSYTVLSCLYLERFFWFIFSWSTPDVAQRFRVILDVQDSIRYCCSQETQSICTTKNVRRDFFLHLIHPRCRFFFSSTSACWRSGRFQLASVVLILLKSRCQIWLSWRPLRLDVLQSTIFQPLYRQYLLFLWRHHRRHHP